MIHVCPYLGVAYVDTNGLGSVETVEGVLYTIDVRSSGVSATRGSTVCPFFSPEGGSHPEELGPATTRREEQEVLGA